MAPLPSDPLLLCADRAVGHDWIGGGLSWLDGPEVRRRSRVVAYQSYRVATCTRCGSTRTEVFEQHTSGNDAGLLVKTSNRYAYSRDWKYRVRYRQSEIRTRLHNARSQP